MFVNWVHAQSHRRQSSIYLFRRFQFENINFNIYSLCQDETKADCIMEVYLSFVKYDIIKQFCCLNIHTHVFTVGTRVRERDKLFKITAWQQNSKTTQTNGREWILFNFFENKRKWWVLMTTAHIYTIFLLENLRGKYVRMDKWKSWYHFIFHVFHSSSFWC